GTGARLGHFEHDLVHAYLPTYLTRVDRDEIDVCFRLHARGAYRDTLRQRGRRERHRVDLWPRAPEDARTRQELEAMLDPLDYQIAELLMKYRIVQGDKGEIAKVLSASEGRHINQGRITRAIQNIRAA